MIGDILNLTRWELFKLRLLRLPWILLAILLFVSQIAIWGNYFVYRGIEESGGQVVYGVAAQHQGPFGDALRVGCNDLRAGRLPTDLRNASPDAIAGLLRQCDQAAGQPQAELQRLRAKFSMSTSLPSALQLAQMIVFVLFAVLAASTIGMDYGAGTLRPILVRGTGRWQYLASKFVTLAIVAAAAFVVVVMVTAVSSFAASALVGGAAAQAPAQGVWADAGETLAKAWFSLLPYAALVGFVTVLTRSSAGGMAIGLGYFFGEQIMVAIFYGLFDWFHNVADYLLGQNLFSLTGTFSSDLPGGAEVSGTHAFLVLAAYMLLLGGLAFWLFQQRDVGGAGGG